MFNSFIGLCPSPLRRPEDTVLLCDHGSPVERVANAKMAVRTALASAIGREVGNCCMERREGEAYDSSPAMWIHGIHLYPSVPICILLDSMHNSNAEHMYV